jgi:uncharacterized membrane protein YdjX (TVP38/TMEM64 family)
MSEMVAKRSMPEVKMEKSGISVGRVVLLAAAVVGLILLGRQGGVYIPIFAEWVKGLGVWGPIAFIAGYVVAAVLFIPGSLLTLAGGAIFGLTKGVMIVFLAAVLGSSAAFLVSRYVARSSIERRLAGNARFAAIDRAVGAQGRKIVFLLRLSPVFPFTLLNYGLGLTNVRFVDYVIASIGMLPGTLLYVYYGKVIGDIAALAGGTAMEKGPADYAILILGLAATIVVTTIVTRIARRALSDVTQE